MSPKEESLIHKECVYNSRYRPCWALWDQLHRFYDCGGEQNELGAACVVLRKQNKTNTHSLKMLRCSDRQRHWLPQLLATAGDRCSRSRPPAILTLILCALDTLWCRGVFAFTKKCHGSSNGRSFYRAPDWHSSKHKVWALSQLGGP